MTSDVRRALVVVVAIAVTAVGGLGYRWVAAWTADPRPSVMGVRLGMTADDVRGHVDELGPGDWTSSVVAGDWVLEHRGAHATARFEIHEGQLVAVRVDAGPAADLPSEPPYEVTPGSVLVRERDGAGTRITLLSRACPTHHEEAERLVAAHPSAP